MHHFLQEKSKKYRLFSLKCLILLHQTHPILPKKHTPLSLIETKKQMIYHNLYCAFFFKIQVRRCYCFKKREASKTLHIKKNIISKKNTMIILVILD